MYPHLSFYVSAILDIYHFFSVTKEDTISPEYLEANVKNFLSSSHLQTNISSKQLHALDAHMAYSDPKNFALRVSEIEWINLEKQFLLSEREERYDT